VRKMLARAWERKRRASSKRGTAREQGGETEKGAQPASEAPSAESRKVGEQA